MIHQLRARINFWFTWRSKSGAWARPCQIALCQRGLPILRIDRTTGFSLLEVLVSLSVCTLFLSALLPASEAALQRLRLSQLHESAYALAAHQIESLAAWPSTSSSSAKGVQGNLLWTVQATVVDSGAGDESADFSLWDFHIMVAPIDSSAPIVDLRVQRVGPKATAAAVHNKVQR